MAITDLVSKINTKELAQSFGSISNTISNTIKSGDLFNLGDNKAVIANDGFIVGDVDLKEKGAGIAYGKMDKRVSLTVAPKIAALDETIFVNKVKYVLGTKSQPFSSLLSGENFYGLLRNALGSTSGLIFPYTPSIDFQHSVNYEEQQITHSNIGYNYYKNTPPPTIGITAKFTADNRKNALHMLSAIWFLTACTKCEFGDNTALPGLPPPILYLNGYNSTIDNIPVIISSIGYKYPEDKHYVNLVLDMTKDFSYDDSFCKIYNSSIVPSYTNWDYNNLDTIGQTTKGDPIKEGYNLSFWLPTEMTITIQLKIQPNFLKTKKDWALDAYKTGILLTPEGKSSSRWVTTVQMFSVNYPQYTTLGLFTGETETKTATAIVVSSEKELNFIPSGWTW